MLELEPNDFPKVFLNCWGFQPHVLINYCRLFVHKKIRVVYFSLCSVLCYCIFMTYAMTTLKWYTLYMQFQLHDTNL